MEEPHKRNEAVELPGVLTAEAITTVRNAPLTKKTLNRQKVKTTKETIRQTIEIYKELKSRVRKLRVNKILKMRFITQEQ